MDRLEFVEPSQIEARSFQILSEELGPHDFDGATAAVVKRVIHATADFEFAQTLAFSPGAVTYGVKALRSGAHVVTDTTMVAAGINKRVLSRFGGEVHTFVADADVAAEARERGITRSAVSMERAAALDVPLVFALGNAPTALVRLCELIDEKVMPMPELVIGVPVGFVNVVESKELVMQHALRYIVSRGRKGGSTVAAAIVNALLYLAPVPMSDGGQPQSHFVSVNKGTVPPFSSADVADRTTEKTGGGQSPYLPAPIDESNAPRFDRPLGTS